MPLSLRLPYLLCYPATRMARWAVRPPMADESQDQGAYYDHQYQSSAAMRRRFMGDLPLAGKVVLDIGSGLGGRAPYWLDQRAERVYCVDLNRQELAEGRAILARKFPAYADRVFYAHPDELDLPAPADVAIMFDVFEHLMEPEAVLRQVHGWLRPGGILWIGSIGWYHYLASHCREHVPIPWCQLLFSERAIIRSIRAIVRSPGYRPNVWERLDGVGRWDRVDRLRDRPGEPLNQLSLRQVRRLLRASPFGVEEFRVYGFGGTTNRLARYAAVLARLPLLQEAFHTYYTARLVRV